MICTYRGCTNRARPQFGGSHCGFHDVNHARRRAQLKAARQARLNQHVGVPPRQAGLIEHLGVRAHRYLVDPRSRVRRGMDFADQQPTCVDLTEEPEEQEKGASLGEDCSICMEDMHTNTTINTSCGHLFHRSCLRQWSQRTCPLCRAQLEPIPQQQQQQHTGDLSTQEFHISELRRIIRTMQAMHQEQMGFVGS